MLEALKDAAAPTAFHDSAARSDAPRCHPHTRLAVLQRITDWAIRQDDDNLNSHILWLIGAAGAGKSSIAQSIIERLLSRLDKIVLASFFFSKSDPTRDRADSLIATLAYQIYRASPAIQAEIASAVEDDPLIFTKTLDHQFNALILQPLEALRISGKSLARYLIVIDGLDECNDRMSQRAILNAIAYSIYRFQLPIAFLVASRQEYDIKEVFKSESMRWIHTYLNLDKEYRPNSDRDIETFLSYEFHQIQQEHPLREIIPIDWPGSQIISQIVAKSTGHFLYASTVVKYIKSPRHHPIHRLDIVRNLRPAMGDLPFKELDALYLYILSAVDTETIGKVLKYLGFYLLYADRYISSASEIEDFLLFDKGEFYLLFRDLGALMEIKGETNENVCINILHSSFQDFLLDRTRSRDFFIDIEFARTSIVTYCLFHLSSQLLVCFLFVYHF